MIMSQVVYPPSDGGKQGIYYRMLALNKKCDLSVAMVNSANIKVDHNGCSMFKQLLVFDRVLKPSKECGKIELLGQFIRWIFSGKPRQSLVVSSSKVRSVLMQYIKKNNIQVVCLESPYVRELIDLEGLHRLNVKIVTVLHNVEHIYFADTNTWPEFLRNMEYQRIKKYEIDTINVSDAVAGVSPWDVAYFQKLCMLKQGSIKYIPSVLPVPKEQWEQRKNTSEKYINFCGTLSFKPNLQGILWFLEHVFSKYTQQYPEIELKITGKVSAEVRNILEPYANVKLTGYLSEEELHSVMLNSLFAVVPIMGGSGVKVKLLESMAYGIPTITTLHGYQGVEFSERTEPPFLVAEDENDFLHYMCGLTDGRIDFLKLGLEARAYFEAVYADETNIDKWIKVLQP